MLDILPGHCEVLDCDIAHKSVVDCRKRLAAPVRVWALVRRETREPKASEVRVDEVYELVFFGAHRRTKKMAVEVA